MKMGLRGLLLSSVLVAPGWAYAQTDTHLEEIVVTAEKRETSLQQTPIAVSVVGGAELADRGVASVKDLVEGSVPSIRIIPFFGRASAVSIAMRGVSTGDSTQISRETSIGIYTDGVYMGRVQGLGTELFEIERVEVLRGPQGTLFGRNTIGGALNIITKRPTGEFGLTQKVGIRNLDGWNVATNLNLPEMAGVSIKLDGLLSKRDGWVNNDLPGAWDWNQYDRRGLRAAALWEPLDGLTALYSYDTSRDKSTGGYGQFISLLPGAPALAPMFGLEPSRVRQSRIGAPLEPSVAKISGHSLNVTWNASNALTLRSITSYRKLSQSQYDANAGLFFAFTPNGLFGRISLADIGQDQFSQEFQVIGTHERLNYVVGAFYFEEDATESAWTARTLRFNATGTDYTVLPEPIGGARPDRASDNHVQSKALFGQATWTPPVMDDRLHLTFGLRYTDDEKHGRMTSIRGVPSPLRYEFSSSRVDPAATVAFDWTEAVNTYVRWGVAYRAGGANSRSATFRPFEEEELEAWELGLKSEFWDRRARLNVAAYRSSYRNRQATFQDPANPSATETVNVGAPAKIRGVEIDLTVAPVRGLRFNANYSFTDGDYPDLINPFSGVLVRSSSGLTPRHAASLSVDYTKPLDFGEFAVRLDANHSSGSFPTEGVARKSQAFTMLNARVTLGEMEMGATPGTWAISAWMKNITNVEYNVFHNILQGTGANLVNYNVYNEPRTFGLDLTYRY
ncbi:TonB-dependent receptor [Phenylobacterium sp. SCN 70-31]|uniref:TonB-dependent receptor n=1 Tax=Phenylobacterium sp. SCN 70-31 TaxID=1660129 RepID=UPI00086925BA|nr:TonB-dependent receptor [Phenylobacterium sp. SCN 70-31]ODT85581.1 MAG: hypothetical protein ABS78_19685 [Phenylobacterium sp. SCN 70-31]